MPDTIGNQLQDAMFPGMRQYIADKKCTMPLVKEPCKGDGTATTFRDLLSAKEQTLSGYCQACQDWYFGKPDDKTCALCFERMTGEQRDNGRLDMELGCHVECIEESEAAEIPEPGDFDRRL